MTLSNKFNFFRLATTQRRNIYVGYIGRKNFGDDLLFDIYKHVTEDDKAAPILDAVKLPWKLRGQVVLGGGTIIGGQIYLKTFEKLRRRPSIVFCAGVIPGALSKQWIDLLKNTKIYTRSIESKDRLLSYGLDAVALVDPAIFSSLIYPLSDQQPVGPVFAPHGHHTNVSLYRNLIEKVPILERPNITLFASSIEDEKISQFLAKEYGTRYLSGWKKVENSVSIIGSASYVISTRLHPAIVAASYGVPVRMVSYDEKHTEFANSISARSALFDLKSLDNEVASFSDGKRSSYIGTVAEWHEGYDKFCETFSLACR